MKGNSGSTLFAFYFQEVSQKNVGSELELLDELLDENWMVYIPIYHIQNIQFSQNAWARVLPLYNNTSN